MEKSKLVVFCGFCKDDFDYSPVRIPLGPPEKVALDETAAAVGLSVLKGDIPYTKACLPCARSFLTRIDSEFLRSGNQNCLKGPTVALRMAQRVPWYLRWFVKDHLQCPGCRIVFVLVGEVPRFYCPQCQIGLTSPR